MKYMTTAEIRESFLKFFEEKGCQRWPSSSLVPDDPSMLLTSAGMVQFKPYFLQQKHLDQPYIGTTTVQKCVRTNDIDIIGTDGRHLSFFEMLGNFAFGAYFKEEMCAWALEYSRDVLGLPFEKLYFTVFEDDDETIEIWKGLGVDPSHITRLGEDDNFWRAGPTGPCGPCSEIYYDQGEAVGCGSPDCAPGCDCDRFLEYWNLVFTQYDGQEDGTLAPLPKKNIDTGMGLERMAAIMQGVTSNFDTDVLHGLIEVGERLTGKTYGQVEADDMKLRVMADHARSVTFMLGDGIMPGNEGREYVVRRLLRRAVFKGSLLGIEGPFLVELVDNIIDVMGPVYPELVENADFIRKMVRAEEDRFNATLANGRQYLENALDSLEGTTLSGQAAFTLHDTYGFPYEVTEEICAEAGVSLDREGFDVCMAEQRARARAATADDSEAAWSTYDGFMAAIREDVGASSFVGYTETTSSATVTALLADGARAARLEAGDEGGIVLDVTPFYAEKGGQVGDIGTVSGDGWSAEVLDVKEPEAGLVVHQVRMVEGSVEEGAPATASIDVLRRERIKRNHSATHILHWALRSVLGDHVKQAGSLVAPDRLRFDFSHFEAVSREQLDAIEALSNQRIMENHHVAVYETSLDEARAAGVTALFGEKYGDVVRVIDMDEFSKELCGGTHVSSTAEIGMVKIVSETSVGANLRRIEAVTSFDALSYVNDLQRELRETADKLGVPLFDVSERTENNLEELKDLKFKQKRNLAIAAAGNAKEILEGAQVMAKEGYPLYVLRMDGFDAGGMRNAWDIVRAKHPGPAAVVFASDHDGTPLLMAAASDEAVEAGFNAGDVIKQISGHIKGGGGGKPTMAQAGGKDVGGLDAALDAARKLLL